MASSMEFVNYVKEQLRDAGDVMCRKMFGEYGIYLNGKIIGVICDDQLFLKITEAGKRIYPEGEEAPPYDGAKPYLLVEDIDDGDFLTRLTQAVYEELPEPKPKKPGKKKIERRVAGKEQGKVEKMDYKKAYKDLYMPKKKPSFIQVPEMTFIMVEGKGNPNTSKEYKDALEILYGLSFTIKMSKMSGSQPEGYFEYVVPPLEGLWWVDDAAFDGTNITDKDRFCWVSMIRQPEFVTQEVFEWAKAELKKKKPEIDFSSTRLKIWEEGLCCQIMHVGPYDNEPATIGMMEEYIQASGYVNDISDTRWHHEIYLGDPRRTKPENLKTVIRHPIRQQD